MSSSPQFVPTEVPARIANLAFSYLRPADFNVVPLPEEKPDFENPTVFLPLQVAMASYGAVVFSVAARPAFGDGSVEDWARFLAEKEKGLEDISIKAATLGGLPAIMVESRQNSDAGRMRLRSAMIEDGMRFLNISVLAPEAIWASVEPTLQLTMASFRLAESKGTTTPLTRADAAKVETAKAEAAKAGAAAAEAVAAVEKENEPAKPAGNAANSAPTPPAELALADDAATLDPEHPMNVRLRNSGAGLALRVLEVNPADKYAVVGAGALVATFRLPFGWHAIDDGKRTLVFDAGGKIQISLNLRRDDGNHRALLAQLMAQAQKEQPQIDPLLLDFAPDLPGLVLRNYRDGRDVLVQAFVVKQLRDDGLAHVARVTAAPDDMTRAMNLTEVILRSLGQAERVAGK
ncbi:DcrB/PsbP domain-containing protein [Horticoccus sp. 23ND18S-11]|uniref:hypothetical protein n=1 Tax=Horticoccus sp. 23ND18S-11 TaxID=3391832 RepID=UPI0039C9D6F8